MLTEKTKYSRRATGRKQAVAKCYIVQVYDKKKKTSIHTKLHYQQTDLTIIKKWLNKKLEKKEKLQTSFFF